MKGKVVIVFFIILRVKKMVDYYGFDFEVVKIGFKYIVIMMIEEDVLVGGEELGGIVVKGYIFECDGIWMGLILWEFMVKFGKIFMKLIDEVYEIVGFFKFE